MPALVHHAGVAALVSLGFVVAALACSFGLPRRLADDAGDRGREGGDSEEAEESAGRPGAGESVLDHRN